MQNYHALHLPQNVEQFSLHICTPKFNQTILLVLVNYKKNTNGESFRERVLILCFALLVGMGSKSVYSLKGNCLDMVGKIMFEALFGHYDIQQTICK